MCNGVDWFPESYIQVRNDKWKNNSYVPSWVNVEKAGLDQFYTNPDIAAYLYSSLLNIVEKDGKTNINDFHFIEPSAGMCAFYDRLPKDKRIGIDIIPYKEGIIQEDFLSWNHIKKKKYIVIGNPPFGYRGWLALSFLNKAAQFSEYVGFILPMSFQSDGKGSPKHRVKGMKLLYSEYLPDNTFLNPNGKNVKVNALWQVWGKGENRKKERQTCKEWIDLFTVDMRKERLCGQRRLAEADCFLQRTFYTEPPLPVKTFDKVKYVCGYGIVIKKDKKQVEKDLYTVDWRNYSNLATHNCRHISMYHIENAMVNMGYVDA
ncbi:MAG: hypothetical protein B0D92_07260 [Spirochaeta sp. LUC14_002_19_P3]|nr:MAG: hypothetical protein B0D92_07260 [Spirochaeta sp. LUC14_002_19_P3]